MIIYKTTNLANGKFYIGKDTKNKNSYLGSGKILKKAIKKHGKENFKKEILEVCKNNDELCEREIYWINFYNSTDNKIGYNLSKGGKGGILGYKMSKKTKNKLSIALKNRILSKEHKDGISKALKNKPKSDIHKKRVSDGVKKIYKNGFISPSKGKKHSLEFRENMTKILQGTSRANKSILIHGIKYKSFKEASEKTGLSFFKIRKIYNNNTINKIKKSVLINDIEYESLIEAHKKTGISLHSIRKIRNDISKRKI